LRSFPLEVRREIGFALYAAQSGGKAAAAKPLKGFGDASVLEVAEDFRGETYRAVYTLRLAQVVYVLHCFKKKSKSGVKTPKQEMDLVRKRLRRAGEDYQEWLRGEKCGEQERERSR